MKKIKNFSFFKILFTIIIGLSACDSAKVLGLSSILFLSESPAHIQAISTTETITRTNSYNGTYGYTFLRYEVQKNIPSSQEHVPIRIFFGTEPSFYYHWVVHARTLDGNLSEEEILSFQASIQLAANDDSLIPIINLYEIDNIFNSKYNVTMVELAMLPNVIYHGWYSHIIFNYYFDTQIPVNLLLANNVEDYYSFALTLYSPLSQTTELSALVSLSYEVDDGQIKFY